jgi:hypothetical protein
MECLRTWWNIVVLSGEKPKEKEWNLKETKKAEMAKETIKRKEEKEKKREMVVQ